MKLLALLVLLPLHGCMYVDAGAVEKGLSACDSLGSKVYEIWAVGFGKIEVTCEDGTQIVLWPHE